MDAVQNPKDPHKAPAPEPTASQQKESAIADIQGNESTTNETEEIFGEPIRSVRFLPRGLAPLAAKHLASALRAVSDNPHDLATWWTLLLWPRRLAEDKDSRLLPRKTRNERLRAQITGEREPPKPEPYETTTNNHKDTLRRAVRKRVDAGQVKNAMKLIINDGKLLAPNVETLAALKDKHPPTSSKALPKLPDHIQTIAFDRESIELAIRSMNTASAAGPDGLRPSHLKQLVGRDSGAERDQLLNSIQAFATACASGDVPVSITSYFFGATLCALRKKDGGVRPIAVGCVMRRVISKAACHMVRERAAQLLIPRQLGIGITNGATAAAHAARRFLSACGAGEGLLKLDFKNAFNSVERFRVLSAVTQYFPELAPYSFAAYRSPTWLFFGSHRLESAQGVQQGDPLGPLLFSLAILEATVTPECRFAVWYLDDGTLGGSAEDVIQGLERVIAGCADIGLDLNATKCEVISTDANFAERVKTHLPGCRTLSPSAAELLGAPLGPTAADASLAKKITALHEARPAVDN